MAKSIAYNWLTFENLVNAVKMLKYNYLNHTLGMHTVANCGIMLVPLKCTNWKLHIITHLEYFLAFHVSVVLVICLSIMVFLLSENLWGGKFTVFGEGSSVMIIWLYRVLLETGLISWICLPTNVGTEHCLCQALQHSLAGFNICDTSWLYYFTNWSSF